MLTTVENFTFDAVFFVTFPALPVDLGFGAPVFPSVARMRIDGGELESELTNGF